MLDQVAESIEQAEKRIREVIKKDQAMQLLDTLPGVGPILAMVIALEVGDVRRFMTAERLASYAGKVPRVNASGGKTYFGRVRPDVNRYLKWAYTEAANVIVLQRHKLGDCHVLRLYQRVHKYHGHAKAVTAVGRHLAEATYWMLKNNEPYREPPVASAREFISWFTLKFTMNGRLDGASPRARLRVVVPVMVPVMAPELSPELNSVERIGGSSRGSISRRLDGATTSGEPRGEPAEGEIKRDFRIENPLLSLQGEPSG